MSKGIKISEKHGVNPSIVVCPTCGESDGIALVGALPDDAEAPRQMTNPYPCEKCMAKFKAEEAVVLVGMTENSPKGQYTGGLVVIKREAAKNVFSEGAIKEGVYTYHCDQVVIERLVEMQEEAKKNG